jgi:hypothetical protein
MILRASSWFFCTSALYPGSLASSSEGKAPPLGPGQHGSALRGLALCEDVDEGVAIER